MQEKCGRLKAAIYNYIRIIGACGLLLGKCLGLSGCASMTEATRKTLDVRYWGECTETRQDETSTLERKIEDKAMSGIIE